MAARGCFHINKDILDIYGLLLYGLYGKEGKGEPLSLSQSDNV